MIQRVPDSRTNRCPYILTREEHKQVLSEVVHRRRDCHNSLAAYPFEFVRSGEEHVNSIRTRKNGVPKGNFGEAK